MASTLDDSWMVIAVRCNRAASFRTFEKFTDAFTTSLEHYDDSVSRFGYLSDDYSFPVLRASAPVVWSVVSNVFPPSNQDNIVAPTK